MRKIIILILFIFISLPCIAKDVLYLNEKWNKEASKILYEHELREQRVTPEKACEIFGYKQSDVRAVFYDLNSDGVNEIIGYVDAPYYWSRDGMSLKILKKVNGRYENISMVNTAPSRGVYVFNELNTNGFYNLRVYPGKNYVPRMARFNKNEQCYEYFFPD